MSYIQDLTWFCIYKDTHGYPNECYHPRKDHSTGILRRGRAFFGLKVLGPSAPGRRGRFDEHWRRIGRRRRVFEPLGRRKGRW